MLAKVMSNLPVNEVHKTDHTERPVASYCCAQDIDRETSHLSSNGRFHFKIHKYFGKNKNMLMGADRARDQG
jgi:hypothetical protein